MVRSDDLPKAEEYVGYLEKLARRTGLPRVEAARDLSKARIAVARGDSSARELFESAIRELSSVGLVLDVALARLELADLVGDTDPHLALEEAQAAAATLEKLGARRWGDRAAQVVRKLGGPSRTGRKDASILTNREREVLRLIGYGYTNAQIGERLFISNKTAGHHVSSLLTKLGMKGRAEATAYAAIQPPDEQPSRSREA